MPTPVLTIQQMRDWEKATWASGRTETEVIAQVGKILAKRAFDLTQPGQRILILAGKGHNGDDARAAKNHLHERDVVMLDVAEPDKALAEIPNLLAKPVYLIIDALFGIGLNRPLDERWQNLIQKINEANLPVLAVDVPSGLNAQTGEVEGAAIRATVTLTLGAAKTGLLQTKAAEFVGRLEVAPEIGLVPCPFQSELNWILPDDFSGFPPRRNVASHKGTYGHLGIFAGSLGYHGAAVLTSRGALRAQPGLVTLATQEDVYLPVAAQLRAAMVHPAKARLEFPENTSAILIGPGLADENLPTFWKVETGSLWQTSPLPMIVDASALDWLPSGEISTEAPRIITPHPGEAARLLNCSSAEIQSDRPAALKKISSLYGNCWVILKGHQTLIGKNSGRILVNSSGNPFLAQGGSGDVLSGFLAGLIAQPALQNDISKTLAYGVWQHGACADLLCEIRPNWGVDDLLENIGCAQRCS